MSWVSFIKVRAQFLNMFFTIQRSYETPRQGRTSPAGTHRHVEGWGLMLLWGDCYAHVMLLLWGADAAVGSWCCRGMGVMRQELMELMLPVFDTKKSSLIDSVSKLRNRVQWTRFLSLETESILNSSCRLIRTYIWILLLLWFLSIFPCTFWST